VWRICQIDNRVARDLDLISFTKVLALIKGSCGAFDYFIQNTIGEDVVVMGHTHEPVAQMCGSSRSL
jgi:predicted phosphodiesterase